MTHEETPLQRMRFRAAVLAIVIVAAVGLVLCGLMRSGSGLLQLLGLLAAAQVTGKWLIFGAVADAWPYGPWTVSLAIFIADLCYAAALAAGLSALERLRGIGPKITRARERAEIAFSQYPGLRRMAFTGVTLWVFLPLPASGAVTGSFAARLVGLSRVGGVSAVAIGSAGNGIIFAAMAQFLGRKGESMLRNPVATVLAGGALAIFIWIGWRRVRRALREE